MIRKTYIPAKPRNRKLINVSGGGGIGRSDISGVVGNSHEHPNKVVIDQILQQHLDVLGVLSIVDGNLKIDANAYSTGELSAYGLGSGGSSGGGVDLLQAWTDYDATKDNWAVKAGLLVPFYNDTKSRLTSLEGGAALSLNVTGSGNAIASLTKSGTTLTAVKANFAELDVNGKILSTQLPSYVDDVLEYVNLAAFPATGETGKIYIAQDSNKTYRWSGTAYVEISASLALGETASTAYRGDRGKTAYDHSQLTGNPHGTTFAQIVSRPTTITGYGITDAYTKTEVNSALTSKLDKSVFDDLFVKVNKGTEAAPVWAIEAKYNFYSVGEISAYGLGSGGSGGGSYERLDAWVDYNSTKSGWVLSALLGVDLNTRVGNLEGGSALTVNTTGAGNAITSISKAGTVITADKGLTFSLSNHLHTGIYEPVFSKNTAFNKNFGTVAGTVAEGNHTHTKSQITDFPTSMPASDVYAWAKASVKPSYTYTEVGAAAASHIHTSLYVPDMRDIVSVPENLQVRALQLDFKDNTSVGNPPTTASPTYSHIISFAGWSVDEGSGGWPSQMSIGDGIAVRQAVNATTWGTWRNIYHTGNLTTLSQLTDNIGVATHIADSTRHVTSTERNTWNAKSNLALGTTSTTAYRGDLGAIAYDHSQSAHAYLPLSGGTLTGAITGTTMSLTGIDLLVAGTRCISYYGPATNGYLTQMQTTSTAGYGTHGAVTGDWALYNKFSGTTDRGWIWQLASVNVASISGTGAATFNGNVTAPSFIGALAGNAASATKLQTARTIAGVSFDGTANIAIPFANLSSKPTTLSEYGITDFTSHKNTNPINSDNTAVNAIGYTNSVSLFGQIDGGLINIAYSTTWQSQIFQDFISGQIALRGKNNGAWTSWRTVWDSNNLTNLNQLTTRNFSDLQNKPTTLVGYGITDAVTTNTTQTITGEKTFSAALTASISVTTPKVIFAAAGWSLEQVGTELQMKHNGVFKQKFLNDGSIAATGELTAYVAGASGYSEFLPLSGGTLTGNLNIGTGVIIGTAANPLSVRGSTFKYNDSDVLYKGNIGTASLPSIGLSDGWTIEIQTTPSSALLIKKNGVIKGTFNA